MIALIHAHPAIFGIALYWIFSAMVGGMPPITTASSAGYQWLYSSLHIIAGNLTAAVAQKFPELPAGAKLTQQSSTTLEAPEVSKP